MFDGKVNSQDLNDMIKHMNVFDLKSYFGAEYYFDAQKGLTQCYKEAAVFVHLYYLDVLDYCYSFIRKIVNVCDVYVTTSSIEVKENLQTKIRNDGIANCKIELVENRGRDIAALVVHNRNIIKRYKYFCFVHDKKSEHLSSEESSKFWLQTLWENTLASPEYVSQIIECFENHEKLGVLSVPEPYWGEFISIVGNAWCGSYQNVVELAQRLRLNCLLSYEKPPITIGTAFWAKTDALKPLVEYKFSPDDFPENGVGTISYAVERIFAYVAQSQGYYTGIIATTEYAAKRTIYLQNALASLANILQHRYCWSDMCRINKVTKIYEKIDSLIDNYAEVYIYGAGKMAAELVKRYPAIISKVQGFVVSNGKRKEDFFYGKKVFEIAEIQGLENNAFIMAVREKIIGEIIDFLLESGMTKVQLLRIEDLLSEIN